MATRTGTSVSLATSIIALPGIEIQLRSRPIYTAFKRAMDTAGALVLLLLLSPLFLAAAIAIVVDTGWPVLYVGERLGRGGRTFGCLKFRTMRADADPGVHAEYLRELMRGHAAATNGIYKVPRDPRVTRVGAFLRRSSIDELPQLWNVLRGEMSLSGPRPEVPYALEHYEPWMYRRFEVTPGMSGLWQVSGRGEIGPRDMFRLDVEYADRCDLWLDLRILALTLPAVLHGTGAG
ncbi:MAG TPA: sugar transferase [Candidatus Limnocylindria bacterium]|jgi:lipopolysaccharide/colanic/teichoic acid biosynthesis glycosyltransferase|nr:sugar transferase [Candidatus Limnocylindria bacterium]